MNDALIGVYIGGFMITLMLGIFQAIDQEDPTTLLLSPVWPIVYLKFIWNYIRS